MATLSVATQNQNRQSGSEDPGRGTVEEGHARTPRAADCKRGAHPRQRVLTGDSGILTQSINPAGQRHPEGAQLRPGKPGQEGGAGAGVGRDPELEPKEGRSGARRVGSRRWPYRRRFLPETRLASRARSWLGGVQGRVMGKYHDPRFPTPGSHGAGGSSFGPVPSRAAGGREAGSEGGGCGRRRDQARL